MAAIILFFNNTSLAKEENYKYSYSLEDGDDSICEVYDPYEKLNRRIFAFNTALDHLILRPIAVGYKNITNNYIKARVGSVLENIGVPLTTVNYGIQMDLDNSLRSLWRFIINTTFGVGGLFDVASKVGLNPNAQTFGHTLAHYGVGPGPYIVLPLIGGSAAREVTDYIFTNNALNPLKYKFHDDFKLVYTSIKAISDRAAILQFSDYVDQHSTKTEKRVLSILKTLNAQSHVNLIIKEEKCFFQNSKPC
jgi:phospholipid-binding lipoprotein MlaA